MVVHEKSEMQHQQVCLGSLQLILLAVVKIGGHVVLWPVLSTDVQQLLILKSEVCLPMPLLVCCLMIFQYVHV